MTLRTESGRFLVELAVLLVIAMGAAIYWFGFVKKNDRPNVILISIDSLRFDRLGSYGYDKPTSPNIDAVADAGTRFENVHSSTTWTLPAHLSLLTGLPDDLHGVVDDRVELDEHRRLLAESFRKEGYVTGGFYSGPYLDKFFGFHRGFDVYENCGVETIYSRNKKKLTEEQIEALTIRMERESHTAQTAPRLNVATDRFLDTYAKPGKDDKPFFLFIHHWDVHFDYTAPLPFLKKFLTPDAVPFDVAHFMSNDEIHADMEPGKFAYLMAAYDAEIAWVDMHIGLLLRKLDELGIADNTIVVITSDHGEEFFEHGQRGHRWNLHEETLRIPLIMAGPGIEKGQVVSQHARIFDVMPTLLDLADLPAEANAYGVSLAPYLRGEQPAATDNLKLIGELTRQPRDPETGAPEKFFYRHDATSDAGRKLITGVRREFDSEQPSFSGRVIEVLPSAVYDLNEDPFEANDLSEQRPALLKYLNKVRSQILSGLALHLETLPHKGGPWRSDFPPDILRQLRENGYIGDAAFQRLVKQDKQDEQDK